MQNSIKELSADKVAASVSIADYALPLFTSDTSYTVRNDTVQKVNFRGREVMLMSAVRDADRIIGLLEAKEEIKSYKLLINRVRPSMIKANDMMSVDDVVDILSCNLIGIIPEDTGIITSTNKGEPIVNDEKSLAGQAYNNVARRISGEEVPFLDIDEPKGFDAIVAKVKKLFRIKG